MKTKFIFKTGAFKIERNNQSTVVPAMNIETEVETTIQELRDLYDLQKTSLKETPALLEELLPKFKSLYKACEKISKDELMTSEQIMQELEREEQEQIQNENLDNWFKSIFFDTKAPRNYVIVFYEYFRGVPEVSTRGLGAFFEMDLDKKIAFSNHMTDYLSRL